MYRFGRILMSSGFINWIFSFKSLEERTLQASARVVPPTTTNKVAFGLASPKNLWFSIHFPFPKLIPLLSFFFFGQAFFLRKFDADVAFFCGIQKPFFKGVLMPGLPNLITSHLSAQIFLLASCQSACHSW